MLAYIKGNLEAISDDSVVIENNNIGYLIKTTGKVLSRLPAMHSLIMLYTYMYVREDEISLYGFLTTEELEVFKLLINISGVGPKAASSILSTLSVDELRMAVLSDDTKAISKANGIGAKGAQRIIIELKDKLRIEDMISFNGSEDSADNNSNGVIGEVTMALASMGFSNSDAMKAIKNVDSYESMSVEELLKKALKKIM